ncbi:hypothetical protein NMS_0369 [Nonlabens marinus S1-08]|uniref:Uncharacterized protein n=1 Tax=Nonlabens marinus S1-08 TaxID=1454201 RepID=W8VU84_9FLAO|nr:hypothetical protein NMS_0369 [Nonlabens marinus S1-08]
MPVSCIEPKNQYKDSKFSDPIHTLTILMIKLKSSDLFCGDYSAFAKAK